MDTIHSDIFPDGTPVDGWFHNTSIPELTKLGKQYIITDYGIHDDGRIYTENFQKLIDLVYNAGGGVIVIPRGTYMTGALFFRQGVNLYIEDGATLMGSDDISDYPVCETRIEGETCQYFTALINASGIDGFTLCGNGTIDGNGLRSWKAFWQRRTWNPDCTNKDEQRARLIYISDCTNVTVAGLHICNSQFWTNHLYRCSHVRYLNCRITIPSAPVKAPSTDAIDIDACTDILIKGCTINVNDDAVALKGGKGPWADQNPDNGGNCDIIIEDCTFGFCHGVLTCGSESIYNHNIILRRCNLDQAKRLLWLKMRPDTPQQYKYILVEDIKGNVRNCIFIAPWTQFYDLKDRKDMPVSYSSYITMRNIHLDCDSFFAVEKSKQYKLSNFCFDNLTITAKKDVKIDEDIIDALVMRKVEINKVN